MAVILSFATDLLKAAAELLKTSCHFQEILRVAQDDSLRFIESRTLRMTVIGVDDSLRWGWDRFNRSTKVNIVIIGFKSCGKTTVGKLLAQRLRYDFVDTDDLIINEYKKSNPNSESSPLATCDIYKTIGPEAFRNLETQCVLNLTPAKNSIIATGGGASIQPDNVSKLQSLGSLIYLTLPKNIIKNRIKDNPPAFLDNNFDEVYQQRSEHYQGIADC